MYKIQKLVECHRLLGVIDNALDELDRIEPYGDLVQNFEDIERIRHTTRLKKMINKDFEKEISKLIKLKIIY